MLRSHHLVVKQFHRPTAPHRSASPSTTIFERRSQRVQRPRLEADRDSFGGRGLCVGSLVVERDWDVQTWPGPDHPQWILVVGT
jgi:hypothetical protein